MWREYSLKYAINQEKKTVIITCSNEYDLLILAMLIAGSLRISLNFTPSTLIKTLQAFLGKAANLDLANVSFKDIYTALEHLLQENDNKIAGEVGDGWTVVIRRT